MTLGDLLNHFSANPTPFLIYCGIILVLVLVLNTVVGSEDAEKSPWNYMYSTIIYLVCVPGIFSVFYSVYRFLFERQRIASVDVYTQIIPVVLMVVAVAMIRRVVSLAALPGFGRISGLFITISVVITLMWILDRLRIGFIGFTYMPIQYLLLIFVGILFLARWGLRKFTR